MNNLRSDNIIKKNLLNFFLAGLSGLLYAFSFPDYNLWFVAYLALVPLFYSLSKSTSILDGALIGLMFGTVSSIFMIYWITVAMSVYGGIPWAISIFLLIALALLLGLLFFAPLGATIAYINSAGLPPLLAFPAVWVFFELLKTFMFTGFPWNLLGYSQFPAKEIIQISDITGVYGISFFVVFINACIFVFFSRSVQSRKLQYRELVYGLFFIAVTMYYGTTQITKWEKIIAGGTPVKFGLIQGNINQDHKWDAGYQMETLDIYTKLTEKSFNEGANIIIWPETATPFYFQSEAKLRPIVLDLAKKHMGWLVFGSPVYSYEKGKMHYLNSAFVISPEGDTAGRYDKMHLVPFGEYVPLKKFLFFVDKLVPAAGDFSSGKEPVLLYAGGYKFGMSICYEIIFPDLVRKLVKNGAEFLVTITNDAWFGKTAAPYQHFIMAGLRAVENRVPLLRTANTGITGYFDQTGNIIEETEIFTTARITGEIRISPYRSFYSKFGNIFSLMCGTATIILLAIAFIKNRK